MRRFRMIGLLAAVLLLFVAPAAVAERVAGITYKPDAAFAKTVVVLFEKARPQVKVYESVCMRQIPVKGVGITVGVSAEDCLLLSKQHCFEVLWADAGPLVNEVTCKSAKANILKIVPARFRVYFRVGSAPVA